MCREREEAQNIRRARAPVRSATIHGLRDGAFPIQCTVNSRAMKGVILTAGKGTRLYPITHHIAKPLLPIANRPTIFYAFDRLLEMGITEVCLVVGENEGQMMAALGDGNSFGLKLTYARQDEPKGLAHAIACAKGFVGEEPFCVYLGDAIYSESLAPYATRFLESKCANLNLVRWVEDPSRFGVATLQGDVIVQLEEKPLEPKTNYAMAGLYFFGPEIWSVLPDLNPSARGEYEITDGIQLLIDRGFTVLAGVYEGQWFDTGTLTSYLETTSYLVQEGQILPESAKVIGAVGHSVVIGDGAHVSCGVIEESVVLAGAHVRVGGRIRRCILAGRVESDEDLQDQIRWNDTQH